MLGDTCLTPSGPLAPLGKRGESIAVGQVAMATDHGALRTALTNGVGSRSVDDRYDRRRRTRRRLGQSARCPEHHGRSLRRTRGERKVRDYPIRLQLNILRKVLELQHCASRMDPRFSPVYPWSHKVKLLFGECERKIEDQELLASYYFGKGRQSVCLGCNIVLYAVL